MSDDIEPGAHQVDVPPYEDEVGTLLPGPRSVRFFKIFAPLLNIDGYKKLKAICNYAERKLVSPVDESLKKYTYLDNWKRWCFGPESQLLLQDLKIYLGRNWIRCITDLKQGEPIHHSYYLSPLGFSKLSDDYLSTIVEQSQKLADYPDFVTELLVLNSLPTACVLGLSLLSGYDGESRIKADPEGVPVFREEIDLVRFDKELSIQIHDFYRKCFGSENVKLEYSQEGAFTISFRLDPEIACSRYEYLRFEEKPCIEKGRKNLKDLMQQKLIPSALFEKLGDISKCLGAKFEEVAINLNKPKINEAYNKLIADLYNLCEATTDIEDAVVLRFSNERMTESGIIELYLDSALDNVRVKDPPLHIWHTLQPVEVSWLIHIYGEDWLSSKVL